MHVNTKENGVTVQMIQLYKLLKRSTSNLKVFQSKHNFSPLPKDFQWNTTLVSTILEIKLSIGVDCSAMYHKGP